MSRSDIHVDKNNEGVTIYAPALHQTIVWDGTDWRKKEGWQLVS